TVDKHSTIGGPTTYTVTFNTITPQSLVITGGLDLDFGASLRSLASVKTSGNVIPLVGLFAHAAFGINLKNPTESVQVAPGTFQPGPRIDVTTKQDGGKTLSVSVLRHGGPSVSEIEILTVRGKTHTEDATRRLKL